jgi:SAM-dependent methyltransferase
LGPECIWVKEELAMYQLIWTIRKKVGESKLVFIQLFYKKKYEIKGWYNARFGKHSAINDEKWWDTNFYTEGVSDKQTIAPKKNDSYATYHYNSIELLILRHILNSPKKIDFSQVKLLDIGSGAGHWIDFWKKQGVVHIDSVDVSKSSFNFLVNKYQDDNNVNISHGKVGDVLKSNHNKYTIVSAIGVMFHIVDDQEWIETIQKIYDSLEKGGIFIVGGHFGLLDGLNVQIDNGEVNKRLRSKWNWARSLRRTGFKTYRLYRNYSYLKTRQTFPENSILIAEKV